jgi:hypothetical protein
MIWTLRRLQRWWRESYWNKVNLHRDDIIKKSGRYMSKRKVKELEEKLYAKLKAKMQDAQRDKDERRKIRDKRRAEREKRREKMSMLRKTSSGTMYYNLIERLDLHNPKEWEYVDITHWDLKNHSQLGMLELSHRKILVFGGANVDNEQTNIKNSFEIDLAAQWITRTPLKICASDKFYYGQISWVGKKIYLLGKKHIHIYDVVEKKFKAIPDRGYGWLATIQI